MTDKLFIDTDIILDLLTKRQPYYIYAADLFTLADKAKAELYISSLCFNNVDYLLSKQHNRAASRRILIQFKILVNVLAVDDKIISLALNSPFIDFEDAVQYYTAMENKIPTIITRNLKDYKDSAIPVMTAEMYLKMYRNL
jgi:predicted nucleic acid-binding protein